MVRFYTNDIENRCGGDSSKTFEIRIPDMRLDASIHSPRNPDNYIFNNSLITKVVHDTLELLVVKFLLERKFKKQERKTRNQARNNLHTHWLQADFFPHLSCTERKEKDRILHSNHQSLCMVGNDVKKTQYIWDLHAKCKDLFIVSKDTNVIIRKKAHSKDIPDKQNFIYFLKNNEQYFNEFREFLRYLDGFLETKQQKNQKNWERFFEKAYIEQRIQGVYTRTVPIINSLSENTRKMLVFELLDKHWQEIAPSKIEAQHILQKDHTKIYKLAEEKGLIEDAKAFASIENERNLVNHHNPAAFETRSYRCVKEISSFFWEFIKKHASRSSLDYYEEHPLTITTKRMNELENQYHSIRSDSMVIQYAQHKHPEISQKDTKHLLGAIEGDEIFMHESSPVENHVNMRCPAAHGQKTKSVCNISELTVQKMINKIAIETPLRQAGIQFIHS